ncbi:MAG TPA: tetratricopeptide repeat protein [Planctomycetia bacterium]|nr:tetratricopeptide repeat protein [Planctomycetia bacterium]
MGLRIPPPLIPVFLLACGCAAFGPPAIPRDPDRDSAHRAGYRANQVGELDDVARRSDLLALLDKSPEDALALRELAAIERRRGDLASARKRIDAALRADPGSPQVRVENAEILVAEGRTIRARAEVERVLRFEPDGAAFALKGRLLEGANQIAAAKAAYAAGWSAQPPAVDAGLALSRWEIRQGEPGPAIERLKLIRVLEPRNLAARELLAEALAAAGNPSAAIPELEAVAARRRPDPAVFYHLAGLHLQTGDRDAAVTNFELGRRAAPDHPLAPRLEKIISGARESPPAAVASPYRPLGLERR